MRRFEVVGIVLTALFISGCSSSDELETQSSESKEASNAEPTTSPLETEQSVTPAANPIPGFTGGCAGFDIWTQNQFQAPDGGYGTKVRSNIVGQPLAEGLPGNQPLRAVGWFDVGYPLPFPYSVNPPGLRGEVWYYIPDLNNATGGWVADAGVRAVETEPAPGNADRFYDPNTQAAPKPPECKLAPS